MTASKSSTTRRVTFKIEFPTSLLKRADKRAAELGLSFSRYVERLVLKAANENVMAAMERKKLRTETLTLLRPPPAMMQKLQAEAKRQVKTVAEVASDVVIEHVAAEEKRLGLPPLKPRSAVKGGKV